MAAQWMCESDLQARCPSLQGGSSSSRETHSNSTQSPALQTEVGGPGASYFPPQGPGFSSETSHYKSARVRMNETLHAKHLAGGLAHTFNEGSNYCYCFTIINKGN